jgi:hypothetical protein
LKVLPLTQGEIQGTLLDHPQSFLYFLHLQCTILLQLHHCFHFVVFRDFHVPHRHPDLRVPQDLLQNRHVGSGQNAPGGERVTQIVEVHGALQTHVLQNTIMGFADGPEMSTRFLGTWKDPVVGWLALPAFLQEFVHFLTHRQRTFGVLCFSTLDQDRSVEEVEIRIGHPKDFIGPHSLTKHDDRDAFEGLGGKCQIIELLFKRQNVNVWNFLRKGSHSPGGIDCDQLVIDGHVQDLLERAKFPIHRSRRHELRFASFFQVLGARGLEVLDHAPRNLIEESVLEQLQQSLEAVVVQIDRVLSQGRFDSLEERFDVFPKQWWLLVEPQTVLSLDQFSFQN